MSTRSLFLSLILLFVIGTVAVSASPSKGETSVYLGLIENAPDPTPTPEPETCNWFVDDFSDPNSGWPQDDSNSGTYSYDNGEYRIYNKIGIGLGTSSPAEPILGDYSVSADMRWEDVVGNGYAISLSSSNANGFDYYRVRLIPVAQSYAVDYFNLEDGDQVIISPTFSSLVNPGTESNHLQLTKIGTQVTIEINGTVVNSFAIQNEPHAVGLQSNTRPGYGTYPAASRFDNFCVNRLSSSATGHNIPLQKVPIIVEIDASGTVAVKE